MFFKNGELDVVGRAGLFRFLSPFSIFFLIPSSFFFSPSSIPEKYSHNLSFFYYYNARKPCLPDLSTKHAPRHLLRQPPPPPRPKKKRKTEMFTSLWRKFNFHGGGEYQNPNRQTLKQNYYYFFPYKFLSFLSLYLVKKLLCYSCYLTRRAPHTHTHTWLQHTKQHRVRYDGSCHSLFCPWFSICWVQKEV